MNVKLTSEALLDFTERKRAFQQAFGDPPGQEVLRLLSIHCRVRETTAIGDIKSFDSNMMALLEGRRQIYLIIQDFLDLTPEQLVRKYSTEV